MKHPDERLLNRDEVAKEYGIPKRFLEAHSGKKGGPPTVRIGRLVRYKRTDIRRWIACNTSDGGR